MSQRPVCFDATGTLIEMTEPVGEVYHRVALAHGVDLPAWRLGDAFTRVLKQAPARGVEGSTPEERCAGERAWWSERVRQTFQATDSTARFDDFPAFARSLFDAYRGAACWRLRDEVAPTLDALVRAGTPMAVVSNFDHRLPEILKALGIQSFFESTHLPFQDGQRKPERGCFEVIAERLAVPLAQLHYVGDDAPETLEAIARLGIHVISIDSLPRFGALPDRLDNPATLARA